MNYANMLDQLIGKSQLSLRQISKRCGDLNITITPSYISQLKNGKLPPPTAEVSMALAKACDSKNESQLIFQGYMEKAPDVIKEYMLASSELNKVMLEALCKTQNDDAMTQDMKTVLKSMDILSTLELSSKYISKEGKTNVESLIKEITLSSGGVIIENANRNLVSFFAGDNAMGPTIPVHAYIYVLPTRLDLLKERDVIAFNPEGRRQPTLRKLFFVDDKILLVPEDKSQQIYMMNGLEELDYVGKVVSYKVDL